MRYKDALRIIENRKQTLGYYIHYSYRTGTFEGYGYIPEPYLEEPFGSEEAAIAFSNTFRTYAPQEFSDIYVVDNLRAGNTDA